MDILIDSKIFFFFLSANALRSPFTLGYTGRSPNSVAAPLPRPQAGRLFQEVGNEHDQTRPVGDEGQDGDEHHDHGGEVAHHLPEGQLGDARSDEEADPHWGRDHPDGEVHREDDAKVYGVNPDRGGQRQQERGEDDHGADGVDEGPHDEEDQVDQEEHPEPAEVEIREGGGHLPGDALHCEDP